MRKMEHIPHDERLKFTQTWFKNMVKWKNSDFNKERKIKDSADENIVVLYIGYEQNIEVAAESERKDIKEWLIDLHQNFDEQECEKLIRLRSIYLTLSTHEKVLYDLYFTKMLSLREIGRQLNLPHMAIYSMINELKQKIKHIYDN